MNENIINFLKNSYLQEDITGFGILIDGNWGCGKTYLINNIVKESNVKSYYISVYGLTDLKQLHDKVYEKLHPILTSKTVKVASTVAKAALKGIVGLDLNKDGNNDCTIELPLSFITEDDFEKELEIKKVIILDDMERCSIPADQIFGFFSEYIIEKNAKVIFICNQEELKKKYSIEKNGEEIKKDEYATKYLTIKEKVIGFDFYVNPDYKNAISTFINEFNLEGIQDELLRVTQELITLYSLKNLRTIRQSFYHLRILYNILKDEKKFNNKLFAEIIKYFEIVYINKVSGNIKEKTDIRKVFSEYFTKVSFTNSENEKKAIPKIPLENIYYNMAILGDYDEKNIKSEFKKWITPDDENNNYLAILCSSWRTLKDSDFSKYFTKLNDQFTTDKFTTFQNVWDYAELLLSLSERKIIKDTSHDIKQKIELYLNRNKSKLQVNIFPEDINDMLYYDEEHASPLVQNQDIVSLIVDSAVNQYNNDTVNRVNDFIKNLGSDLNPLLTFINGYNNLEFESSVISIFEIIDTSVFYSAIKSLDIEKQFKIFNTFESVYKQIVHNSSTNLFNKIVSEEANKLEEISKLYFQDCGTDFNMSPEKYEISVIANKYKKLAHIINTSPETL